MSSRFHNKWHRHNHHTYPNPNTQFPDSGHDPIASSDSPFLGEFILQGALSANATLSSFAGRFINQKTDIVLATPEYAISGIGYTYLSGNAGVVGDINIEGNVNINGNANLNNVTAYTGQIANNLTVFGNLSVLGSQTTVNVTTFNDISALNLTNLGAGPVINATQTGPYPIISFADESGPVFFIPDNGNTGIKTVIPNKELTVIGEISATSNVTFDLNATIGNAITVGNGANIAGTTSINGNTTINGITTVLSSAVFRGQSMTVSGTLSSNSLIISTLTSNQILTNTLTAVNIDNTNINTRNLSASNYLGLINGVTTLNLGIGGSERVRINNLGYVGINTTAPTTLLQIDHPSNASFGTLLLLNEFQAGNSDGPRMSFKKHTPSKNWSMGIASGNTTSRFAIFEDGSTLTFGSERISIAAGGNVGIGTNNPGAKLEVVGSVAESFSAPAIGGTVLTLELSAATFFRTQMTSNITSFTLLNVPASPRVYSFTLQTVGDLGSPTRTVTWLFNGVTVRWNDGFAPSITPTVNKIDTFTFVTYDGGVNWFGFISGQNM
jgi:hypothetical protein